MVGAGTLQSLRYECYQGDEEQRRADRLPQPSSSPITGSAHGQALLSHPRKSVFAHRQSLRGLQPGRRDCLQIAQGSSTQFTHPL